MKIINNIYVYAPGDRSREIHAIQFCCRDMARVVFRTREIDVTVAGVNLFQGELARRIAYCPYCGRAITMEDQEV